jgi:phosphomannomutase / phosphoglucomutase
MITGSHNPPEFNGFKVVCGTSTIHGEAIQEIRRLIETGDLARGEGSQRTADDVVTPYVEEIASQFHFARRIRVVVDAGNGTGGPVMGPIAAKAQRATPPKCSSRWTAAFRITIPTPPCRKTGALVAKVRRDRRRPGHRLRRRHRPHRRGGRQGHGGLRRPVDDRLRPRDPHPQARRHFHRRSEVLAADVRRHPARGGNAIMWKTGHSLIKAKMKETHAELAGEMSGHMFFADRYYGFDDAIYAACRLMEIVANPASRCRRNWPDCRRP